jgi:hypothetical protein
MNKADIRQMAGRDWTDRRKPAIDLHGVSATLNL